MSDRGDNNGRLIWMRIRRAICELQAPGTGPLHLILPHPAAVILAILTAAPTAGAEPEPACRGAAVEYDIARAEIQEAAQVYQRCLAAAAAPAQKNFIDLDAAQDRYDMPPR